MSAAALSPARNGAEQLADAIAAAGVDTVFGLLADGNLRWLTRLVEDHGVAYVGARHDSAAVAMAEGFARARGEVALCTVGQGPGLTQCGTTLTQAAKGRVPVLLIAGDTDPAFAGHQQNIDQEPFVRATGAAWIDARDHGDFGAAFATAYAAARSGTVVLDAPLDLQEGAAAEGAPGRNGVGSSDAATPAEPLAPDPAAVEAVAAMLAAAERPLALAGRGAVAAAAHAEIVALAAALGAPLATTLLARGWFRDEPLDLGVCGGFAHDICLATAADAGLVLAFGAGLSSFTTRFGTIFPQAKVVAIDPAEPAATVAIDAHLRCDARRGAAALLEALPNAARHEPDTKLATRLAERSPRREAGLDGSTVEAPASEAGVDPRAVGIVCDELLPADRVLVTDAAGHLVCWPAKLVDVGRPENLILPWEFGAMGLSLPVAIGAALARPEQTTVTFEGDGSLMTALTELDTAARAGVRLLIVVMDDGAYGAETYMATRHGIDPGLTYLATPDLVAIARGCGLEAARVTSEAELRAELGRLLPLAGPALLQVQVTPGVWFDEVFRSLTG